MLRVKFKKYFDRFLRGGFNGATGDCHLKLYGHDKELCIYYNVSHNNIIIYILV